MVNMLTRHWWAFAIRGVVAIIFGILALIWPGMTFAALTLLFGSFALADGVFAIVAAVRRFEERRLGGWLLFEGVFGVIVGILAFLFTGIAALTLLYMIAAWAVVTGVLEIAVALDWRLVLTNAWFLILSGIASIVAGLLLFFFPSVGIVAISWVVGFYAILFGALGLSLAWQLYRVQADGAELRISHIRSA